MRMRKAIYIPTNTPILVMEEVNEEYVKVFMDTQEQIVERKDIKSEEEEQLSSFAEIEKAILHSLVENPVSDLFYSYNTNKLVPEHHQYKPLVKMLKSPNNRLLIADEVGLGKTIEAGMIYKEIDKRNDVDIALIVVPSSLTLKWRNEMLFRFNEEFDVCKVNEFKRFLLEYKENFERGNGNTITRKMIVSYHTLRDEKVVELLEDTPLHIDILIMDEAHTFRNRDTATFEGAERINSVAENIVFLTATPVQNSQNDLFNILSLLDNDSYMDKEYFLESIRPNRLLHKIIAQLKNHYDLEDVQNMIKGYDLESLSLTEYQQKLVKALLEEKELSKEERVSYVMQLTDADNLSHIVNRTKKKDIGLYIRREATSQTIPPSPEERIFYQRVIEFIKMLFQLKNPKIPAGFITIMPERMASSCMIASIDTFKTMRKTKRFFVGDIDDLDVDLDEMEIEEALLDQLDVLIAAGEQIGSKDSKYQAFENIVDGLQKEGITQMIVFSFFKKTLSYLEEKLNEKGLRVGKIDGDLTPDERYAKIQAFTENKFDILLSSEVGSEGLDMQFCNVVVNYDMPWNPMRVEQRIGRIDRIGQKADKLLIFNLCIKGTIEDKIYSRLYNKLDIFESSIGELEPILGDLQKTFDVRKMIEMSDEEIILKVNLEADALIREKKTISEQMSTLDSMINDEYNYDVEVEGYINEKKEAYIQRVLQTLFLDYLNKEKVGYTRLKNDTFKINQEDANRLSNLLVPMMAQKSQKTLYKIQKNAILKIKKLKPYRFTFKPQKDNRTVDYISLSHPIIRMISKKTKEIYFGYVKNPNVNAKYAVVYRQDIKALKQQSTIEVMLFDADMKYRDQIEYTKFLSSSSETEKSKDLSELLNVQEVAIRTITEKNSKNIERKKEEINRLINQKILGMQEHFSKRRAYARKKLQKVSDSTLIRMYEGEVANLYEKEVIKKAELENQKQVSLSYTILSVMGIMNDK